jgi:hypothetical protein
VTEITVYEINFLLKYETLEVTMEITNTTFKASTFYQTQKNSHNKSAENTTEKSANIEIDSTEVEYTKGYDLENITPHETYALANELYKEGQINVWQLASMMIIGLKHEYHLTNKPIDHSLKNNEPFNLMKDLNSIAANQFQNYSFHPKIHENIDSLIDTLLALPEESLKIKQTSIDISV